MALTAEGRVLTDRQRLIQLGLRSATIRDILRLLPMWEPTDPASWERFVLAVVALTQARAKDSAAIAARYYEMFRDAELESGVGMTMGRAAILADPPSPEQIRRSMEATVKTGYWRATFAGYDRERALREAAVELSGSMARHVMNGGRDTIQESVRRDPRSWGWARITDAKPCYFCAMLASRGPVYKESTVGFRAHDHCTCTAQPVFSADDWPGDSRQYQATWNDTKKGVYGQDAINAFRRRLEGRE